MTELLKQWSELEPERCEYQEETEYYHVMRNGRWTKATIIATLDYDRIQGAVQEAIDDHDWVAGLTGYGGRYLGTCSDANADRKGRHEHESAAAALLSAYLKALEAKS